MDKFLGTDTVVPENSFLHTTISPEFWDQSYEQNWRLH